MTDRDKLIELFEEMDKDFGITCPNINTDKTCKGCKYQMSGAFIDCNFLERKVDYLLANGVIVPKFNVGDTVWYITGIHRTIIKSAIVEEIIINSNGVSDLYVKNDMGGYFENSVDIFYKTKEEAEAELRKKE